MKKIIPTQDMIVAVIPQKESEIALPDGVQVNREAYLVVEAIGPDVKKIAVGDRIVTVKGTVVGVKIEGKDRFMVKEEFVIGVIAEEAPQLGPTP